LCKNKFKKDTFFLVKKQKRKWKKTHETTTEKKNHQLGAAINLTW